MRLETKVLAAAKRLKEARTSYEWACAVRQYNKAQDRYAKYHGGAIYQPYEAVNTPERHNHHD